MITKNGESLRLFTDPELEYIRAHVRVIPINLTDAWFGRKQTNDFIVAYDVGKDFYAIIVGDCIYVDPVRYHKSNFEEGEHAFLNSSTKSKKKQLEEYVSERFEYYLNKHHYGLSFRKTERREYLIEDPSWRNSIGEDQPRVERLLKRVPPLFLAKDMPMPKIRRHESSLYPH